MKTYFDIETEGLPVDQISKLMPEFTPPQNIKDPVKIAAAIEDKKRSWLDTTALKAITGKIVAVTIAADENTPKMFSGNEEFLVKSIVNVLKEIISKNDQAYAWNGHGFDLPFICQRAAVYSIPAFKDLTVNVRGRFYWRESLIDPKLVWSNYSPDHAGTSLKSVALALGLGEKSGRGKYFAELLKTNPDEAEKYAVMDVELLRGIVNRMGI